MFYWPVAYSARRGAGGAPGGAGRPSPVGRAGIFDAARIPLRPVSGRAGINPGPGRKLRFPASAGRPTWPAGRPEL